MKYLVPKLRMSECVWHCQQFLMSKHLESNSSLQWYLFLFAVEFGILEIKIIMTRFHWDLVLQSLVWRSQLVHIPVIMFSIFIAELCFNFIYICIFPSRCEHESCQVFNQNIINSSLLLITLLLDHLDLLYGMQTLTDSGYTFLHRWSVP